MGWVKFIIKITIFNETRNITHSSNPMSKGKYLLKAKKREKVRPPLIHCVCHVINQYFSGAQEATWQELVGAQKRQCRKGINLCWAARQNKEDDQVVCKVLKTEESNMIVLCLQRNWTCVLQCFYGELTLYTHSFFCLTGMNITAGEPKSLSGSSFFFFSFFFFSFLD